MKICFLDKTDFEYDSSSVYSSKLRGAECVLINLSKSLSENGHDVTIINNCPANKIINNIRWINIKSSFHIENYDLVISNGDCNLFNFAKSNNNILFSHSIQSIEKFIRKNQLLSYLKFKPKVCFISNYHQKNRNKLLYLFGFIHLRWSVDEIFLNAKLLNFDKIDKNLSFFSSRENRNQNLLINIWKELIISKNSNYKLLINDNGLDNVNYNIINRNPSSQKDLLNDLLKSRMFLIPGHKSELFCLSAAEAKELCIPIVTLGIGCLSERVEHGVTGFIAKNRHEFRDYVIELYENDNLWIEMRNNLIKKRSNNSWNKVSIDLVNKVFKS